MAKYSPGNSRTPRYLLLLLGVIAVLSATLIASLWPGSGLARTAQASSSSSQNDRHNKTPTATPQDDRHHKDKTPTETPSDTMTIRAKALNNHECNDNEWHFVITQIRDEDSVPSSIEVTWANGESETVDL